MTKSNSRKLSKQSFLCAVCEDKEGHPKTFNNRKAALLHHTTTGHRVVGHVIYTYDYGGKEKEEEEYERAQHTQ